MGTLLCVIVHLNNPREKYWGAIFRSSPTGIWLTGVELKTMEEWISGGFGGQASLPGLASTFFPMHRVEKITVDETIMDIPSVAETIILRTGARLEEIFPGAPPLPPGIQ